MTEKEFRSLEIRGEIKTSLRNAAGFTVYDEDTVRTLCNRKDEGGLIQNGYLDEQGNKVFRLLKDGMSLVDITIETGYHPQVIRAIVRDWDLFSGSITIPKSIVDQMKAVDLDLDRPIDSASQIMDLFTAAVSARLCKICKLRDCASSCRHCIKKMFKEEEVQTPSPAEPAVPTPADSEVPVSGSTECADTPHAPAQTSQVA